MTLKRGDSGMEVVKLQHALLDLGCSLPRSGPDGDLGGETLDALAKLLAAQGRTFDGDLDTVSDEELAFVYGLQQAPQQAVRLPVPADRFFDLRARASGDGDRGERAWTDVTGVCLHQTACVFGENPEPWRSVVAHIGITRGGRVMYLHDFNRLIIHGNGWNAPCVGIEMEGDYAGIEGNPSTFWRPKEDPQRQPQSPTPQLIEAAKAAVRWVKAVVEQQGSTLQNLVAHRQSSSERQADPGSALWRAVALPLHAELGLSDGGVGFKLDTGLGIPEAWDPRCKGIPY